MLVRFDYQEVTSPSRRMTAARRLGMDDTKRLNVSVEIFSNSCRLSCNCRILQGRRWVHIPLKISPNILYRKDIRAAGHYKTGTRFARCHVSVIFAV
ncbi:hypothetical protein AVEN_224625-1 [Araneus ventricosus]|uniref:Uncharacterized protein n=1 Tax=Araneus ventricosus TaxID=182803 RepID=A0A4Y2WY42_ARAVE|nr:hypothetical protein AVEN_219827-1 [Araneus ventricosus]GBO42161.1 hypothetical protein AVEN_224625-1 [Araneus ventricosus]